MGMEMRQELRLSQQLVMTPQLQQAIKLLQLSRMELADMVHEEMLENPILEDDFDVSAERSKERELLGSEDQVAVAGSALQELLQFGDGALGVGAHRERMERPGPEREDVPDIPDAAQHLGCGP